jgi:hypothetical protein
MFTLMCHSLQDELDHTADRKPQAHLEACLRANEVRVNCILKEVTKKGDT